MSGAISYEHQGGLYLNVTNRCPTACVFCVKTAWDWSYRGSDLRLGEREPSVDELIREVEGRLASGPRREIVFCGYGEPTLRLEAVREVGLYLRLNKPAIPVRLNTIGLGSLASGRDIVPELAQFLDAVSVSLNAADPDTWERLHRPAPAYRGRGYGAARDFIRRCVRAGLRTRVTAIEGVGADLDAVRAAAREDGAEFLARPALV